MATLETESNKQATQEKNKQVVRGFIQTVFTNHRVDRLPEFFSPQGKWHGGNLGTVEGSSNVAGLLQGVIAALPDVKATEQNILAEGDLVSVRLVVEGTHKGNLLGFPATGKRVRWDAIDMYRVSNGKIVDDWASEDVTKILADIGAYTPPWMKGN